MASQTQTIRRPQVQAERVHDYLYDKHYVLASERDHARSTFKAHTGTDRVRRIPNFTTMFSELRHHPRYMMRLDVTDPVPKFISRQWRGYADQQREALVRHTTFNYDPSVKVPKQDFGVADVSGANRYKYFRRTSSHIAALDGGHLTHQMGPGSNKRDHETSSSGKKGGGKRPIIPFMQQVPPDVLLASARQDPLAGGATDSSALMDRPPTPPNKTVETQTDYRDSEAQTDPYTPEYVVRPGSQPELLTLATLSHGHGLPAGLAEVEMIERARAKRAWEATLPPLNDTDQLDKRRRMMDDMERKEWSLREQEIEKLQEARLEVLKTLLRQREEHHQELNTKRLDRLWANKQEEKEEKVKTIRNEHIKTIRKLTEKRRKVEGKLERRDIVHQYSDYGSQVYAPMTRIGVFLDRGSEQYVVKSRYLNTYQGLLELEQSLPDYVIAPRIKAPKPKTVTKSGFIKRRYRRERELAELHQTLRREKELAEEEEEERAAVTFHPDVVTEVIEDEEGMEIDVIKQEKDRVQEPPKALKFLQKIEKPIPRPPTPAVEVPSEADEDRELATILLQQVIRGRAIQNMMFEGKEKRIELIRELRSTHALQEAEQQLRKQEKQATLALQRQRRLHEHKESHIDESLSQMEGSSLGDALDFLSKELIRLQEERNVHAFSMLAERQRRIREAEESGRRQLEERRRREEDEIFKQVVHVHQETVDTYLEDIILASIDRTADEQAREEIQHKAEHINDIAYELEERRTGLESEEIVSELVHGFLIPEVQKIHVREKVKVQQRKYLAAAHHEIHTSGEGVIDAFPRSMPQKPSDDAAQGSKTATPKDGPSKAGTPKDGPSKAGTPVSGTPKAATPKEGSPRGGSPKEGTPRGGSPKEGQSKAGTPTPGTPKGRQSPEDSQPKAPSRTGSASSRKSQKSASGEKPGTPDLGITGTSAVSPAQSRPGSAAGAIEGSKPATPKNASKPASRTATPSGSRPGSGRQDKLKSPSPSGTPAGSKPTTPKGGSPAQSKAPSEKGSKPGTPSGSRPASGASQKGSHSDSKHATPKSGSQAGSKPPSEKGSKPPTPTGSRPASASSKKSEVTKSRPSSSASRKGDAE